MVDRSSDDCDALSRQNPAEIPVAVQLYVRDQHSWSGRNDNPNNTCRSGTPKGTHLYAGTSPEQFSGTHKNVEGEIWGRPALPNTCCTAWRSKPGS
ncbi:Hypp1794 [Branchiostoma lanceolatum]|uniref:Hypp1794 protein n=1 Tax=Branchiostoma lanceolatum TaxID=7740 RepID=A0A8K0EK85_BRALA|nr:Hypp1794 [Branchiostoma lanceolatum]